MKSPWNFFERLVSRDLSTPVTVKDHSRVLVEAAKAKGRVATRSIGERPWVESRSSEARNHPIRQTDAATSDRVKGGDLVVDAIPGPPADVHREDAGSGNEGIIDVLHPVADRQKPRSGKTSTSDKRSSVAKKNSAASEPAIEPQQTSFEGEVAAVEAELRRLRRQLAEKLSQQNSQLRELLERFDSP